MNSPLGNNNVKDVNPPQPTETILTVDNFLQRILTKINDKEIQFTNTKHKEVIYIPHYGSPTDLSSSYNLRAFYNPLDPEITKDLPSELINRLKVPNPFGYHKEIKDTLKLKKIEKKENINMRANVEDNFNNIKVVIQITVYDESSNELYQTIKHLTDNYEKLQTLGYTPKNILIAVVVDGKDVLKRKYDNSIAKIKKYYEETQNNEPDINHIMDNCEFYSIFLPFNIEGNENTKNSCCCGGKKEISDNLFSFLSIENYNEIVEESKRAKANGLEPPECHFFTYKSDGFGGEILFAIKEKNGGKLNSQYWIFQGICGQLTPEYLILIDCGTLVNDDAIYHFVRYLKGHDNVGGVCGEIEADFPPLCDGKRGICEMMNDLCTKYLVILSQYYEYKSSHYLDKSLDSVFGFIPVLPGAFSAYKFAAICGVPLDKYFLLENADEKKRASPFTTNMYLAEDRILCLELLAKANCNFQLKYVKDAISRTDTPDTVAKLMSQRRRWLNGTLLAALYSLFNWNHVLSRANHNLLYKLGFSIQFILMFVNQILSLFTLSNFFMTYRTLMEMFCKKVHLDQYVNIISSTYLIALVILLVYNLGNRSADHNLLYSFFSVLLGIYNLVILGLSVSSFYDQLIKGFNTESIIVIIQLASAFGSVIIAGVLHGFVSFTFSWKPKYLTGILLYILSFLLYFLLSPTYMILFPLYALSNLHDVSWGTRASQGTEDAKEIEYKAFRTTYLFIWIVGNIIYCAAASQFLEPSTFLNIMLYTFAITSGFKILGCILYLVGYCGYKIKTVCGSIVTPHPEVHVQNEVRLKILDYCQVPSFLATNPYEKKILLFYYELTQKLTNAGTNVSWPRVCSIIENQLRRRIETDVNDFLDINITTAVKPVVEVPPTLEYLFSSKYESIVCELLPVENIEIDSVIYNCSQALISYMNNNPQFKFAYLSVVRFILAQYFFLSIKENPNQFNPQNNQLNQTHHITTTHAFENISYHGTHQVKEIALFECFIDQTKRSYPLISILNGSYKFALKKPTPMNVRYDNEGNIYGLLSFQILLLSLNSFNYDDIQLLLVDTLFLLADKPNDSTYMEKVSRRIKKYFKNCLKPKYKGYFQALYYHCINKKGIPNV